MTPLSNTTGRNPRQQAPAASAPQFSAGSSGAGGKDFSAPAYPHGGGILDMLNRSPLAYMTGMAPYQLSNELNSRGNWSSLQQSGGRGGGTRSSGGTDSGEYDDSAGGNNSRNITVNFGDDKQSAYDNQSVDASNIGNVTQKQEVGAPVAPAKPRAPRAGRTDEQKVKRAAGDAARRAAGVPASNVGNITQTQKGARGASEQTQTATNNSANAIGAGASASGGMNSNNNPAPTLGAGVTQTIDKRLRIGPGR